MKNKVAQWKAFEIPKCSSFLEELETITNIAKDLDLSYRIDEIEKQNYKSFLDEVYYAFKDS